MGIRFPTAEGAVVIIAWAVSVVTGAGLVAAAVDWITVAVGIGGGGGIYASGIGGKKGACGCPKVGFNPGSGVGGVSVDGGGGGGGGGTGNPMPGAVVAR